jgi:hypothetical protein
LIYRASRNNGLAGKGGNVPVFINNLPANNGAIQLFIDPQDSLIRVSWQGLGKSMVRETLIWAGFAHIWSLVIIDSWIFFDVDNREIPITIAILGNERFA